MAYGVVGASLRKHALVHTGQLVRCLCGPHLLLHPPVGLLSALCN